MNLNSCTLLLYQYYVDNGVARVQEQAQAKSSQTFRPHNEYVNTLKHNEQYMHASVCTFCVADIRAGHIIMNYKLKAAGDAYTSPAQKSDVNYTIIEYITHDQHVSIV